MQNEKFWELIEESKTDKSVCEDQSQNLLALLGDLEPEEVISFQEHFNQKLVESFRWDLWAIAYLINGGASDDGFFYFRGWLISQGKAYFEAAIANPEAAAKNATPDEFNECESILYVARQVYKSMTGNEIPITLNEPPQPAGESWEEEDIEKLFPEIAENFF